MGYILMEIEFIINYLSKNWLNLLKYLKEPFFFLIIIIEILGNPELYYN
jgi:hypothetical protein